ncbi:hypothetical protein HAX54_052509, partial [Datura stramonium]|nr:hypothetical protein [Datura stramonium]
MVQGIPIGLTGMTVSPFESVKSEFRSNHTTQYTRPSNSLRDEDMSKGLLTVGIDIRSESNNPGSNLH